MFRFLSRLLSRLVWFAKNFSDELQRQGACAGNFGQRIPPLGTFPAPECTVACACQVSLQVALAGPHMTKTVGTGYVQILQGDGVSKIL